MLKKFNFRIFIISAIIGFGLITLLYWLAIRPATLLFHSVSELETTARQAQTDIKNQDLGAIKDRIIQTKNQLDLIQSRFRTFAWTKPIPFLNRYYADGGHVLAASREILAAAEITIEAITPYADIIGLKGLTPTGDGSKTAQDRINFILNTLDKISPQLQAIGNHLDLARTEITAVNPNRYPGKIRNITVRDNILSVQTLIGQAATLTTDARPFLESAPYILGMKSPRKYLVIFQNDAELRPTGGFMTAYAILEVNKGKINTILSDDIYNLDSKVPKKTPAPEPIIKYLPKVPYWNLRDMNLSPDFKASMDVFYTNYKTTGSPKVDGIIAMDTQVLVDLLKITGRIGVPGFGNFSAETDPTCNCPQAFYALELYADVEGPVIWDSVTGRIIAQPSNYGQRKSFIGPMMYSILTNVMAQPKSKMADLFGTAIRLINQKHILMYFMDEKAQSAAETFNLAGRIRPSQGDYLMVVDTNFAGAKTNAWVTYTADLQVQINGDNTVNTLTLTYKNPQHFFEDAKTKLRLNGIFRDWLRVYVPKGSKLLENKGFENQVVSGEDLDKTVFEGFFTLAPLNNRTLTLKYQTPYKTQGPYQILIQKQGGSKNFPYSLKIGQRTQPEIILDSDKDLTLSY